MLGPLPPLHRVIVTVCALAACLGLGAWISLVLRDSLPTRAGLSLGAAAALPVLLALLHVRPEPHRARVRAHRR